ncbi:MAG: hypothetical protein B6244_01520 [Candidatus Cloacimonetes bacterium 4572_55]|nr:MAG: hypothetical protein B6244_01520 [Candidatus Cloacimonetes bacterium 4572_55]
MDKNLIVLLSVSMLILLSTHSAWSYFGQNKVQYRDFEWHILPTRHFDIHFYEGTEELAYLTAKWAEEAHDHIAVKLNHEMHKRIPLIIYGSHLDFQQTNVTSQFIDEGLQGFTESLKNRVVVHYQGSFADYKHLLTHELVHAVMFDMLYGNTLSPQQHFFNVPLWFAEGLAEYVSHFGDGWDPETEMFVRDAVLSEKLVPLEYMSYYGGYMVYKGGQSAVRFIAKQYGDEKLGEIIEQMRIARSFENALKKALGVTVEQLSDEWLKLQKRHYLPQYADIHEADEISKKLTDHVKDQTYLNMRPVFSPDGASIAFFSDRKTLSSIYLMSVHDGKIYKRLVKAHQNGGYEQLHVFNSNLTWSPDSKQIAFVSKNEGIDCIYLHDVEKNKSVNKLTYDFNSIQSPDWSPSGEKIVFSAIKEGRRDLYIGEIETGRVECLTNDRFDDMDPRWSPDGQKIAFATDRFTDSILPEKVFVDSTAGDFEFGDYNIAVYDLEQKNVQLVVDLPSNDKQPVWSPGGDHIAYISDYSGTFNLYIHSLESSEKTENYQLTNLTGGVFDPSWSRNGEEIVFSAFQDWGWDLFILEDPLNSKTLLPLNRVPRRASRDLAKSIDNTFKKITEWQYSKKDTLLVKKDEDQKKKKIVSAPLLSRASPVDSLYLRRSKKYSEPTKEEMDSLLAAPKDRSPRLYKPELSVDYVNGGLAYAYDYGFYGGTALYFSDILGNHNLQVLTNLTGSIDETDILGMYFYLPKRLDYGIGVFHEKNNFIGYAGTQDYYYEEREYGLVSLISYPFSRFERVDFSMTARGINRKLSEIESYTNEGLSERYNNDQFLFEPSISLVRDTAIWGYTGPVGGTRVSFTVNHSPGVLNKKLEYTTGVFDYRHYLRITRRHQIAFRGLFALSAGPYSERFRLGGPYTMIGYETDDKALQGSKISLVNIEFRFPFIDQVLFRWPLPIFFQEIRGAAFLNLGTAWDDTEKFRGISYQGGKPRLKDIKASYGIGARLPVAFFILRFDLANKTDFDAYNSKGIFQFSIGSDF